MTPDSSPPGGSITVAREDAGWVAMLTGEVDAAVVQAFTADTAAGADPTAVETADVTFIDSSGLALILRWASRARERGTTAELRAPSDAVLTLLRLSGTESMFRSGPESSSDEPPGGAAAG